MAVRRPERFQLDFRSLGMPSIPVFGRYHYQKAMPRLAPHRHAGAIEICFLARGRQIYEVGGKNFALRGGDLFLTFPGENHGTGREPEEKGRLFWLVVLDPRLTGNSLLGLPPCDSLALWQSLLRIRRKGSRHFPASPGTGALLESIADAAHAPQSRLRRVLVANRVTGFLLSVLAAHAGAEQRGSGAGLQKVFTAISQSLDDPQELTVPRLAGIAGLSASRFQAKFKEATGLPPAEYVLRARISEAKRRLALPGSSVTRIAHDLGFSSSQYFAVTFRRFTGRTPSEAKK
jgi:AraC-like DNA-binding protein